MSRRRVAECSCCDEKRRITYCEHSGYSYCCILKLESCVIAGIEICAFGLPKAECDTREGERSMRSLAATQKAPNNAQLRSTLRNPSSSTMMVGVSSHLIGPYSAPCSAMSPVCHPCYAVAHAMRWAQVMEHPCHVCACSMRVLVPCSICASSAHVMFVMQQELGHVTICCGACEQYELLGCTQVHMHGGAKYLL